ncbi:hypothetical protein ABT404_21420 [Streptomyces hyaluromycini]|uniref:Uncharacterized protein n=1 Tax=Streptomyces hyaluromycini TaxID=1377993 RepID=A0ABV1WZ16_9ACTN
MRIAMALTALMLVLGSVSALGHARKGRWSKAAEVVLPVLGGNLVLFGGVERHSPPLFWLGVLLVVTGLGIEGLSLWRSRAAQQRQKASG